MASITASAQVEFEQAPFKFKQIAPTKVEVSSASQKDAGQTMITEYDVPSTVTYDGVTYTVTAIGEDAFKWRTAEKITLPETIDTIRANGFNTFDVGEIALPKGLRYIGDRAFSSCKFTSIVIPDGVEELGNGAFFACKSLASVTLPSKLKTLGPSAFYGCAMTGITLPSQLTEIPASAFQRCESLETVTIQSDITAVGKQAFLNCKRLKSVNLPSSVQEIGYEAFCNTALESFTLPKGVTTLGTEFISNAPVSAFAVEEGNEGFAAYDGAIYSKDKRLLWAAPVKGISSFKVQDGCVGICGGAFSMCEATEITLPESVIAIDGFAFCEAKVEKINFPSKLQLIGEQAFAGTALTELTLPETITTIYEASFAQCEKLKKITLPKTLTDIAIRAFLKCTALESITCLGEKAPALESAYEDYEKQFYDVPSTCQLIVPKGATQSYKDAGWGDYFTISEAVPTEMTVVSTIPADGATITGRYYDMQLNIYFDEDFDIVVKEPAATLRQGDPTTGKLIEPDDCWNADRPKANLLNLWASDWDGFMCTFNTTADTDYYLHVPAGIVKGKSGRLNAEMTVMFTTRTSGIGGIGGETEATVTGVYDMSGRKIANPGIKGVVIKKMSNGKSVKVLNR